MSPSLFLRVLPAAILGTLFLVPVCRATGKSTPECRSSGLVVWLNTEGDGAAGSTYFKLQFTNLSGARCTLTGYPGVSGVNLRGRPFGSAAGRDTVTPVRTVTLANGATKTATLRIVEAGNFPSSRCHMTMAAGLRVYPPNQRGPKIVPFPFFACSRTGPVYLSVSAVS